MDSTCNEVKAITVEPHISKLHISKRSDYPNTNLMEFPSSIEKAHIPPWVGPIKFGYVRFYCILEWLPKGSYAEMYHHSFSSAR